MSAPFDCTYPIRLMFCLEIQSAITAHCLATPRGVLLVRKWLASEYAAILNQPSRSRLLKSGLPRL